MSPSGGYQSPLMPATPRDRYQLAELYYDAEVYRQLNSGLLPQLMSEGKSGGIRELENPTEQAVEFHADHMFPGTLPDALPILSDNLDRLGPRIEDIWITSNWSMNKQVYARWLPLYGDAFIQAAQTERKRDPYMELIHPGNVSMFDKDERGNLIYMLMETEVEKVGGGILIRAEEWDRDNGTKRVWYASGYGSEFSDRTLVSSEDVDEDDSGEVPISSFGIDFVPFVHAVFMPDLKDPKGRGVSAIARKVAQIDEIARMVTTIHDRFFRYGKPDKAVMAGEANRGAPRMERNDTRPGPNRQMLDGTTMQMEDGEKIYRFPGMSHMEYLVANLPYEQGLAMIQARQKKLAETWAELRYFEDVEQGDPSGIARRNRLAPAVSRTLEGRGNAEDAQIRGQKMCLTLGKVAGIEGFRDIGSFDNGDFDHSFEEREVLPVSDDERETALGKKLENAQRMIVLKRSRKAIITYLGWDDDDELPGTGEGDEAVEEPEGDQPTQGDVDRAATELAGRFGGASGQQEAR